MVTINVVTVLVLGYFVAQLMLTGGALLAGRFTGVARLAVGGMTAALVAAVCWFCWLVRSAA